MSSKLTAVRAATFDLLGGHTWTTGTAEITYGLPLEPTAQDLIVVGGMQDPNEDEAALGPAAKRELRWLQELIVDVFDPTAGDTAEDRKAVDAKAFSYIDEIRALVLADPTLGGLLREFFPTSVTTDGLQPGRDGGWGIVVTQHIRCAVRI